MTMVVDPGAEVALDVFFSQKEFDSKFFWWLMPCLHSSTDFSTTSSITEKLIYTLKTPKIWTKRSLAFNLENYSEKILKTSQIFLSNQLHSYRLFKFNIDNQKLDRTSHSI